MALKTLLPELRGDARARAPADRGGAAAARGCTTATWCRCTSSASTTAVYYVRIDCVDGADLAHAARARGRRPSRWRCTSPRRWRSALDYVHRAERRAGRPLGLVHRDVSPANVLVSRAGEVQAGRLRHRQGDRARGRDARQRAQGQVRVHVARSRWRASRSSAASDQFALGVTLIELLTGQPAVRRRDAVGDNGTRQQSPPPGPAHAAHRAARRNLEGARKEPCGPLRNRRPLPHRPRRNQPHPRARHLGPIATPAIPLSSPPPLAGSEHARYGEYGVMPSAVSPRHPVTPSPRHPVTPSPRHPVRNALYAVGGVPRGRGRRRAWAAWNRQRFRGLPGSVRARGYLSAHWGRSHSIDRPASTNSRGAANPIRARSRARYVPEMFVTWLGHAQLFLNAAGRTLLLDPWFFEPVFGGAWFRYPPPPYPDASTLPRPDFLLLSHIHPDHSGPETLERLLERLAPARDAVSLGRAQAAGSSGPASRRSVARSLGDQRDRSRAEDHLRAARSRLGSLVDRRRGRRRAPLPRQRQHALARGLPADRQAAGEDRRRVPPFAGASGYPTGFDGDRRRSRSGARRRRPRGLSASSTASRGSSRQRPLRSPRAGRCSSRPSCGRTSSTGRRRTRR